MKKNSPDPIPVMDYHQYRRARRLVHECCNYDCGNCIALDDGEECVCVQSISCSLLCRWFKAAVLPLDKELETALFHRLDAKKCAVCGALFTPGSNRAKYCPECAGRVLYSNILLKLYLKSLKNGGRLQLDEDIPYTAQMIATITRQQIGTVERAL